MGVKDLWEVLSPVACKVQLDELRGKRLAVDLSGWIVESEQMRSKIREPVIRNLFFRCNKLLGYGIKLVFVLEGTAPEVKEETLSQRSQARGGEGSKVSGGMLARRRPALQAKSSECRELLDALGLPYVQSTGEAEGTCAFLDKNGMVDGCITQDGDAFLYGAKTVYRKLSIEDKDPHVLSYKIEDIETKLGLDRRKLVALAVLVGCDYFDGVRSVGKETALKLLDKFGDTDSLERLRDWTRDSKYSDLQEVLDRNCKKRQHCGNCQHPGTQKLHHAHGCIMCSTDAACVKTVVSNCTCEWHKAEAVKSQWRTELDVRKKALDQYDTFPPENVISEFLTDRDDIPGVDSCWQFPSAKKFEDFMYDKLSWGPAESREKLFPLLTRCHLERGGSSCEEVVTLKPVKIVKERVRKNADFYEVEWLATELWTQSSPPNTLEPQELFEDVYPELVKAFYDEQNQKSKKKAAITDGTNSDIRGYFTITSGKSQQVIKDESEGTGEKRLRRNAADIASKKSRASPSSKSRSVTTRMRKLKSSPAKATETVDRYFARSPKFSAKPLDVSVDSSLDEFNVPLSQRIAGATQEHAEPQPTSSAGDVAPEKPGKPLEPVHVVTPKPDSVLEESVITMEEVLCPKKDNPVGETKPNSSLDTSERADSSSSITSLPEQKPTISVQEKLTTQPDDEARRSTSPTSAELSKRAKSLVSADDGMALANISTKEAACVTGADSLKSSTQTEDSRKPSWPGSFNLSLSDSLKEEFMTSMQLSNGEVNDAESDIGCTPPKRPNLAARKSITSPSGISPDRLAGGDAGGVTASSSVGPEGLPECRISGRRRLYFNETVTSTPVSKQCSREVEIKVETLSKDVLASYESQVVKSVKLESEESYDHSGSLFDSRGESLELSQKNRQPSVIVLSDDEDSY
ncbi:XPG-like endonuclease isoform X1 [Dermacentor variabilis]|uniref:XPG-like endonuclease isoform X1 n=2 Tax=Dermacentor variabilis TaxID=34621 RepID=UPI003F5CB2C7